MFDIGWSELLVIGVVALIVVGPKDLPGMFHTLGRFTAKARSMAREFSRAMEDAAKESGVGDVAKDLKGLTSAKSLGLDKVQAAATKFEAWDPMKKSAPAVKEPKPKGPATQALSEERAATKAKVEQQAAERAEARKAAEASRIEAAADAAEHAPPKPAKAEKAPAKAAKPKAEAKPKAKAPAAKPKAPRKAPAKKTAT